MTFRILTVCTGNICRSPLAEQLLRNELSGLETVVVSSAGTGALVGHPMDERAAACSRELGGRPDAHVGRQLTAQLVRESDLVLAAARRHRKVVVQLSPRASRSAFTIREFARLLHTLNADDRAEVAAQRGVDEQLAALVDIAASNRGVARSPEDAADDDVLDPYRQDDSVFAASIEQLVPPIRSIGSMLRRAGTGFA